MAVANFLTTPWGAVMTTIASLATAAVVTLSNVEIQALVFIWTFFGVFWSIASIVWLFTRRNVLTIKPERDYSYRLCYERLSIGYDPQSNDASLQIGIFLRNCCSHPLRFNVVDFLVILDNRTVPTSAMVNYGSILSPMGTRLFRFPPFPNTAVNHSGRSTGEVRFTILYGHPDDEPERKLSMKLSIDVVISDQGPRSADLIADESDTAL